ncbi:MAG: hypothetical protein M1834_000510 [Cirrosporium novae-zelandiae]|nr:MAG: hypothetical protein M1834_000510 [Cirrosporium novae-zelandiae]
MATSSKTKTIRIGVDVGGTNTDAVVINPTSDAHSTPTRGILAHSKTPTTAEVTNGIEIAVGNVLDQSGVPVEEIACVTIGTTHFINAVIEQDARRLKKVAIIRLSKSFLREIPPFSEFPVGLKSIINGYCGYVDGGLAIDGSQEAPVVESQVVRECQEIKARGLKAVVIAGIFSPIDEIFGQEKKVREIVLRELPGVDVVCSHEVANIGFMERENAAILNASILQFGRRTVRGFREAMRRLKLNCGLYITQNDGTLIDAASAAAKPIVTFCSGATNSMRGAAYLAGATLKGQAAIVVDIGGTTSDCGVLLASGFPRQASAYVRVAGVKVNYSMPLVNSIGLGGGSIVREENGKVDVGPDSVGLNLITEAKVFGGKVLTATDIAVAGKKAEIGDSKLVTDVGPTTIEKAQQRIKEMLEGVVDLCKTSPEPVPVLLVGGGSVIAPETLKGASSFICPPYHDVANAVGAAVSKVGGTVDIVQNTSQQTVQEATEHAKDLARQRALQAGAIADTVIIAEVDSMPLQYVANQVRTVVKAVGELDVTSMASQNALKDDVDDETAEEEAKDFTVKIMDEPPVDPISYRPRIETNEATGINEWLVSETDLEWLAEGCYVLGCAGGGSPAATRIQLRDQLRAGYKLRIIDVSSLAEDAHIYWGGHMGSPAVSNERLNATETIQAVTALMEYFREDSFDAVMGLEIGGSNGLEPLLCGSTKFFNRPVLDADWMGRAYPTYWQTSLAVHCPGELVPCAIDSGDGKSIIMTRAPNDEIVDRALRASCAEMGSRVGMAAKPTTTDKVKKFSILNTSSLAWRIGRCIAIAEASNTLSRVCEAIVDEVGGETTSKILFRGKIIAVERRLFKGHSYGEIIIGGLATEEEDGPADMMPAVATGGTMKVPFKNENLYAEHTSEDGEKTMIATVPDLIAVLDTQSGRALGVPEFRYGLRVTVLGIACSPQWNSTQAGIDIGGPKAFGYDIEYKPFGVYVKPRSVIEEYAPS